MRRRKGDLPGRVVPPHMRKKPNNSSEYGDISGWQEHVEPIPSPVETIPPQGELELVVTNKLQPAKVE
jgi:hypothetical protein